VTKLVIFTMTGLKSLGYHVYMHVIVSLFFANKVVLKLLRNKKTLFMER